MLFILLGGYFSDIYCTFRLGQMLDSYGLFFKYTEFLALQLLYITVRIPDGMFLFPLAGN